MIAPIAVFPKHSFKIRSYPRCFKRRCDYLHLEMTDEKTILLIVNLASRRGCMDLAGIREALEDMGRLVIVKADDPREIPDAIRQRASGADLVVLGGGDGTLNRAANALMEIDRPVGILPLGTANNLARSLSIPLDPLEACRVLGRSAPSQMHPGLVNGAPFFTVAHVGLGARINQQLSARGKERWGIFSHVLTAARALKSRRSFSATIYHDGGHKILPAIEIAVGIGQYYGPGIPVDETTVPEWKFHVFLIERQSFPGLLAKIPALLAGRIGCGPRADRFRTAELYVESDRPAQIAADGELIEETPATFKIQAEAIRFMVPPGSRIHGKR